MTPARTVAAALMLAIPGLALSEVSFSPGEELANIKSVPIGGILRVTREDGKVFYVSEDRRWVIVGEVIDMWTGAREHEINDYDRISWERAGTTMRGVSMMDPEAPEPAAVIFVARECQDCMDILRKATDGPVSVSIAPIGSSSTDWGGWQSIWCKRNVGLDFYEVWIQDYVEDGFCEDERAGRAMAFAHIFGFDHVEPTLIDRHGYIYRGKEEIAKWLSEEHS